MAALARARVRRAKFRTAACKEEPMANRRLPDAPNPTDPVPVTDTPASRRAPAPAAAARSRKSLAERAPRLQLTPEARRALIAETAYLRAERRGFTPGHETEDWVAAEAEVDALLKVEGGGSPQ
jgi:Protein of unknown function (DUF2934)